MSKTSPTQRSIAMLKERGYLTQVVERWNPHARVRVDLYGFGDILAVRPSEILLVQTTSGSNLANRIAKIKAHANYASVIGSGMKVCVHGWRKLKAGWRCNEVHL